MRASSTTISDPPLLQEEFAIGPHVGVPSESLSESTFHDSLSEGIMPDAPILSHGRDALRDSEVRYRRLFEAARDGILILDPESRKITDANPL